jgi:4-hydroxythreonine-4-phosphate dehydrogenase
MKKKILLLSGDPNSVNSEIIYKSWKKLNSIQKKKIYLISNFELLKKQFKKLNYKLELIKVNSINENENSKKMKILDIKLNFSNPFNIPNAKASKFVIRSLNKAHNLALSDDIMGFVNCPISKTLLKKKNFGVTEFLALKCKIKNSSEVMLLTNKKLSISPITTHVDVKEISKNIKFKVILNKILTIYTWFKKYKNISPRIAVLGLNPHNAEFRKDSEEMKIIIPAIKKLKKKGLKIQGPFSSDTIFLKNYKNYDVIVGMYHDQILGQFKTLFKYDALNITLGLKYIRVSPDHGPAKDLIGKNKANCESLIKCINFIQNIRV